MVSFTITEKGYSITSADGSFRPDVKADFEAGPEQADSYIGKLSALCYWRYTHGAAPLALVSMDNCSHNGDKLYAAVDAYAKAWTENGKADSGFLEYIENPAHVSFPWSMIDKITPRPDDSVKKMLEAVSYTHLDVYKRQIICATDRLAFGAYHVLGERGLRIPEDVSVAGFGGYDESTLLKPDLTTLRFDSYGLGYLGAETILKMIHREPVPKKQIVDYTMIEGHSVKEQSDF